MKERGISFSTEMIAAYVSGDKTQTRRTKGLGYITSLGQQINFGQCLFAEEMTYLPQPKPGFAAFFGNTETDEWYQPIYCPYGSPGDILYTREEHLLTTDGMTWCCEFKDGNVITKGVSDIPPDTLERLKIRKTLGKWQRARFQPRIFSRDDLVIKAIRVERLQEISQEDAVAEGIERADTGYGYPLYRNYQKEDVFIGGEDNGRLSYKSLWENINGPGSWDTNPWVWVIEFENVNAPGNVPGEK